VWFILYWTGNAEDSQQPFSPLKEYAWHYLKEVLQLVPLVQKISYECFKTATEYQLLTACCQVDRHYILHIIRHYIITDIIFFILSSWPRLFKISRTLYFYDIMTIYDISCTFLCSGVPTVRWNFADVGRIMFLQKVRLTYFMLNIVAEIPLVSHARCRKIKRAKSWKFSSSLHLLSWSSHHPLRHNKWHTVYDGLFPGQFFALV